MKILTQELTDIVSDAFEKSGYSSELGNVIASNRPDLCDFQCDGAFKGAKLYKKAPLKIAEDVAEKLKDNENFSQVTVAPPGFINLTLADEKIVNYINEMSHSENAGIPKSEKAETIVIDYGGPNIAKPLHIGHLRSAIIGESIKRLMEMLGCNVISDVHLGDWGLQIGLVIAELSERYPEYSCFTEEYKDGDELPPVDVDSLNEIYPFASGKSKTDEIFSEKAHRFTHELQQGKAGFIALWRLIWDTSVGDLKKSYEKLNVDFDYWYGESDADKYVDKTVSILEKKGILEDSDGAKIVVVEEETDKRPVPPAIIIKSDGAVNYETTDIATILQREEDFSPDKIWYVVDKRQELHFLQVFRAAKKSGIAKESTELEHLGFGTMNGSDGKPYKTRDGGVMRLGDMIETVTMSAMEKIRTSEFLAEGDNSDSVKEETARKIGVAAIKFGDLINHRTKDYIFDIDRFLSFEGKTGTYILYMITRINSILNKASCIKGGNISGVYSPAERTLMLRMMMTSEIFWLAARDKAPNHICENAYQIATEFSAFYHDNHILSETDEEKKASWISLCYFVRELLLLHLDVLGIDTVDAM